MANYFDDDDLQEFADGVGVEHDRESEANARLIAAAPDLYDALAGLVSAIEGPSGMGSLYEIARALPRARAALSASRQTLQGDEP